MLFRRSASAPLRSASLLAVAALAASLGACDTVSNLSIFNTEEKYKPEVVPEVPPEQLYNEGLARLRTGDHSGAAKKFSEIDRFYPFSTWAKRGMVMTVYAHYERGEYDEAIGQAQRFLQLNPSSPDAPYAQYLLAESHYRLIPDTQRDQERSQKALAAYRDLVQRWPKSEYVEDARYKITVTQDQLAGAEMNVGRHFLERRNYVGAVNRFRVVITNYQTTRHVEEALMRLTEAYMALGVVNEAQTAAAVLGHNFPDSPWYKDSYKLLQTGGLEPREDRGSWISRQFAGLGRTVGLAR